MKGIILAGGSGTRLYPTTKAISKQLCPVYDKPMIYYSMSILMLAGIKDILIITRSIDLENFKFLFSDGNFLGINISYAIQENPNGLAEAFIIGEDFIKDDNVCLILGDNIFYGDGLISLLKKSVNIVNDENKAVVFGYYVEDPQRYGIVEFDESYNAISIEEKPQKPKSNYAITGLYFYPNSVIDIAKKVKPSLRGELEISSVNSTYLDLDSLKIELMGRGFAWFDTGTFESLLEASNFIYTLEKRQGLKIACIEEIAYKLSYISKEELKTLAKSFTKNSYGKYLLKFCDG